MAYLDKSYTSLKNDFIYEMDYIANIGTKLFLFPFIGRSKFTVYCYHFTYYLVFLTSTQLFITLCLTGFHDWFEIINIAPNLGVCLMILIKYGKIHKNKDLYDTIFHHFRHDLWKVVSDSKEHKRIVCRYTRTTKFIIRFEFYYTIVLAIIVDLFPRLIMLYETDIAGKEKQYLYPFDGWYPFDKVQWYYVAYIWESFMTTVVIFLYVFVNMLHISYTRYICMELRILGNLMEEFISKKDVSNITRKVNVWNTHYKIRKQLKFIISKHKFLTK